MKIKIQKYNPSVDPAPHFEEYEITHTEHMTLLEALVQVNDTIEPLLSTTAVVDACAGVCYDAQRGSLPRLRDAGGRFR